VHLSTCSQVAGTASRFYADCSDLQLLIVDRDRTGAELRWEESEPGQRFPHVYGPVPIPAVRAVMAFAPAAGGTFVAPLLPPAVATGVRPLDLADAERYVALAADAHQQRDKGTLDADQLATVAALWDDGTIGGLVYEESGDLVAGVVWTAARLDRRRGRTVAHTALIAEVATAPAAWGRGLGSLLLHHALAELRPLGYDTVELWTQADNLRARRLYERHGWARTSSLPGIGRDGSTLVQYQRPL
jgi:ribosomal protein S18 acetylase RimI-like enzyme